jgi:hypothetical protein
VKETYTAETAVDEDDCILHKNVKNKFNLLTL